MGIDAIKLEGKDSGSINDQYKNLDKEYPTLNWNWTELTDEIHRYCLEHGIITNDSSIIPQTNLTNVTSLSLVNVWQSLDFEWVQWDTEAVAMPVLILWDKATWKKWLIRYQEVINAFIYFQNSILTNTPFNLTLVNSTAPVIIIWKPIYDNEDMTLIMILQDLNGAGLLVQFETFFTTFFGASGLVEEVQTDFGIPMGLADIVDFIEKNIDKEVRMRCRACEIA